jgi:hypothetical protein
VDWIREGEVSLPRTPGESDSLRVWRPWVLEEADGTLRMWYTGDDGTTSRILRAVRPPGGNWDQPGIAIDAGSAGDSDSYGAESPCVVKTPGGYLMVYGSIWLPVSGSHPDTGRIGSPRRTTSLPSRRICCASPDVLEVPRTNRALSFTI